VIARFKDYAARTEPANGMFVKARQLLKDAGYARQPLRWFTTQEYEFLYKNALVAKQQLEEAGIVVDLQVVDWATLDHRTEKPEGWDMSSTGFVVQRGEGAPTTSRWTSRAASSAATSAPRPRVTPSPRG
jgi:ABC-type transport system substrate-binding protein